METCESLQPEFVDRSALTVTGLRYAGRNEHGEIPALWDEQFIPLVMKADPGDHDRVFYGVTRQIDGVPWSEGFEYLAAVAVGTIPNLPDGLVVWEMPAQQYAVLPAQGVPSIGIMSEYFYGTWLPRSAEWEAVDGPMLEVYPASFPQDMVILMHFPVRPRSRQT